MCEQDTDNQKRIEETRCKYKEDFELAKECYYLAEEVLHDVNVLSDDIYSFYIVSYYCKIHTDFKAIYMLFSENLMDQGKTILRTMLEKVFKLKALINDGDLQAYYDWFISQKKTLINHARKNYFGLDIIRENIDETERKVREKAEELGVDYEHVKSRSVHEWAKKADMVGWYNLVYDSLSSDVHAEDSLFSNTTRKEEGTLIIDLLPTSNDLGKYLSSAIELMTLSNKAIVDCFKARDSMQEFRDKLDINC